MGDKSQIQWTDATWNPVTGCSKVSPGCKLCYAERIFPRAYGKFRAFTDVRCHEDRLEQPLRWKKPRKIFVNSMSDLFHENVSEDFIFRIYQSMGAAFWHTYQILTKRPERALELLPKISERLHAEGRTRLENWKHVWHGVSVENQLYADQRIPILLRTPVAVRFVSYEPALEPIDFGLDCIDIATGYKDGFLHKRDMPHPCEYACGGMNILGGLDWVIVGGESGQKARPFNPRYARSVLRQCAGAGIPVFVKQMGAHILDRNDAGFEGDTPQSWPIDTRFDELGKGYQGAPVRIRLKNSHGGNPDEWPEDLRVRQFPEVRA